MMDPVEYAMLILQARENEKQESEVRIQFPKLENL